MFSKEQLDRYARHIILPGVGASGQRKLLDSSVLVVGAGGLGSPVLLYLAAAGVGRLGIADFDTVEVSNLQRQIVHDSLMVGTAKTASAGARVSRLNPEVEVTLHEEKLEEASAPAIIRAYDLVVDGSDNFATRYLVNDLCVLNGKPLVYGAIAAFEGQLSLFHAPDTRGTLGPCYRCLFPEPPPANSVPNCAEAGVFGALPGVIGSMMAVETIKTLVGLGETLAGKLVHYDALYSELRTVAVARKPGCAACGEPGVGEP